MTRRGEYRRAIRASEECECGRPGATWYPAYGKFLCTMCRSRLKRTEWRPCPCECNRGGFCGGCGHAGCAGRRPQ